MYVCNWIILYRLITAFNILYLFSNPVTFINLFLPFTTLTYSFEALSAICGGPQAHGLWLILRITRPTACISRFALTLNSRIVVPRICSKLRYEGHQGIEQFLPIKYLVWWPITSQLKHDTDLELWWWTVPSSKVWTDSRLIAWPSYQFSESMNRILLLCLTVVIESCWTGW